MGYAPSRHTRGVIIGKLIKTFPDRETERLYTTGLSRQFQGCARTAFQKLRMVDGASRLTDLGTLPGNRLEALKGDRRGQYSIRVNDQYRITFRFEAGGAWEVRCEDYH